MKRDPELTKRARELRNSMTLEEITLWRMYLKDHPASFRRQYVIGSYIVDFYCHQSKLVIELDGSQHYEPKGQSYDQKRTEYLQSQGLTVIRFSNSDIKHNLRGVCDEIDKYLKK